ncbi:MAG: hypothetical protein OXJ64_17335 [Boseongicola sp.]|nr:hypothetical protein [Boseongicola sp.]
MRFVLPALLVLVGLGGLLLYFERGGAGDRHDADLCPLDTGSLAGSATLLLDFRKPLDAFGLSLPGTALQDLSLELGAATELRAFALTGDVDAPRQFIGRLCKPYDNADLSVGTAKDQRGAVRDCDDLPAQVPTRVRELAQGFCERRAALQDRIYAMARRPIEGAVVNAHLLGALDDTLLEFVDRPRPHTLYVFSDMMQHSDWYSHLDLDWTEWGFAEFLARRDATYPSLEYAPAMDGQRAQIYYLPRRDRTGQPRTESAHKEFWRAYFADARVVFRDQPAMSGYAALPLMDIPTEAEVAAQERDEAERLLALVQEEQAMLAEAREEAREQQEQARREMEEELRRRQEALEAEVERLRAEAEARAALQEETATADADTPDEQSEDGGQVAPADAVDAEAAVADTGVRDSPPPEPEPCDVDLLPGITATAAYPRGGRFNLGDAVMLVRYTVDEEGATPDDEVFVDPEGSSASRSRNFDTFAETARQTVRRWEFEFDNPDEHCLRRQERSIAFEFQYE